jgi:hypothetical protein
MSTETKNAKTMWAYVNKRAMADGFIYGMLQATPLLNGGTMADLGMGAVNDSELIERVSQIVTLFANMAVEANVPPPAEESGAKIGRKIYESATHSGNGFDHGTRNGERLALIAETFANSMDEVLIVTSSGEIMSERSRQEQHYRTSSR